MDLEAEHVSGLTQIACGETSWLARPIRWSPAVLCAEYGLERATRSRSP